MDYELWTMDYELRQQLFPFLDGNAATLTVVGKLLAVDTPHREIASLWMADEQATDRG